MTTHGKHRHLTRCSTEKGQFLILAIDHRGNLRADLDRHAPQPLSDMEFAAFKGQIAAAAGMASAVLTDPDFGIGSGIANRSLNGRQGLLAPLEVTNYDLPIHARQIHLIPNWSVEKAKLCGVDGIKLLVFFHPKAADAAIKRDQIAKIAADCARWDIPLFLEPIPTAKDAESRMESAEVLEISCQIADQFSPLADVLKMQFPLNVRETADREMWQSACRTLDAACRVPWALLSGGVDFETFIHQAEVACATGSSGVIVGRAVWQEAVALQGEARQAFLGNVLPTRLTRLTEVCQSAAPWHLRVAAPNSTPHWYAE